MVDGEEKLWTFGIGRTPASTFGQLVELATKNSNKLIGVEFSVVVKFDGTTRLTVAYTGGIDFGANIPDTATVGTGSSSTLQGDAVFSAP